MKLSSFGTWDDCIGVAHLLHLYSSTAGGRVGGGRTCWLRSDYILCDLWSDPLDETRKPIAGWLGKLEVGLLYLLPVEKEQSLR